MAMLAEPRRKQKIGPNPRGKFFMEDTTNKGRTLLQKLGWQTGDGLGKSNQGMSAPICPKIQNDAKGLGYDPKNDPWVVHNEEFSQILQNLQPIVPDNAPESNEPIEEAEEVEVNGKLESKSKKSKFRIHYHKFVRNKDVSNFSKTDLKCIFGKPTDALLSKPKSDTDPDNAEGSKYINSGSMADYFKAKMLKLKSTPLVPEVKSEEDDKQNQVNRGSMLDYFKAKMEERRQKAAQSSEYQPITGEDEVDTSIVKTEEVDQVGVPSKKSKKKRKHTEDEVDTSIVKTEESEEIPSKKSKKSKPAEEPEVSEDLAVQNAIDAQKEKNFLKREKRKKAKHAEGYEPLPTESVEIVPDEPPKKKKKKSKEPEVSEENSSPVENQEAEQELKKKKKKKKSKYQELDESVEDSSTVAQVTENVDQESTAKKSKKRSKSTDPSEEMQASNVEEEVKEAKKSKKKKSKSSDEEQLVQAEEKEEAAIVEESSFKKKKEKKYLKPEELNQVSKGFPGANLHEISGYAFY